MFLTIAAALFALAAPAATTSTLISANGHAAPPTPAEAAGDPGQIICKRIATTGTRLAKNDCRTRSEWNQLTADSRQATHDLTANQGGLTATSVGMIVTGK